MKKNFDNTLQLMQQFAQQHNVLRKGDQVLVAVSGGLDSVTLLHLLTQLPLRLGVAHCNFGLRGAESDADEELVKSLAKQYGLPFYHTLFDTESYAKKNGISTQMAARELRYQWLDQVRKENGFHFLAVAHHKNDNAETLLLNLVKGTGIAGLSGMAVKNGHIIRPMLDLTREQIKAYAELKGLTWREDASNASNKYQRNSIRNQVIPLLQEINPNLLETLGEEIQRFKDTEDIYQKGLTYYRGKLLDKRKDGIYIAIKKLATYPAKRSILFEILRDFGFNAADVDDMLGALDSTEAKQFVSATHRVVKDRDFLILCELATDALSPVVIEKFSKPTKLGHAQLKYHVQPAKGYQILDKSYVAAIDQDKLELPLVLRPWKQGDYFYPLGLNKKKKVNRFLMDQKLGTLEKERTLILTSGDHVVWVVGQRMDHRFRVTEHTKTVLEIKYKDLLK